MIYKFKQFESIDITTIRFIDGLISEKDYKYYIESEVLNESLGDYVKEKITNVLYTFLTKAYSIGFTIIGKFKSFFTWLIETVSKWKDKHPILHKVIITTLIVIILLLISAASAHAQSKGNEIPTEQINTAIGWLEVIKGKTNHDPMLVNKAMAHLIDIRDGQIDITNIGQDAINMADAAMNTAEKMMTQSKEDNSLAKMCLDLMHKGSEYVSAIYSKSPDKEVIKLGKA
jgi:stage V sporulation protein SpoVS